MKYLSPFTSNKPVNVWDVMSRFDEAFKDFATPVWSKNIDDMNFPAVDIEDRDGKYLVTMDIPGMKEDEIKVDLNNRTLTVSGERNRETKKEEGHYYERVYGSFSRSFNLPTNVEAEKIEAHYEHGVLKVSIPKTEAEKTKTIKVKSTATN